MEGEPHQYLYKYLPLRWKDQVARVVICKKTHLMFKIFNFKMLQRQRKSSADMNFVCNLIQIWPDEKLKLAAGQP